MLVAAGCLLLLGGCGGGPTTSSDAGALRALATTTILRDLAQQVAGDRFTVEGLVPLGVDPHEWEPSPADVAKVLESDLVIVNGGALETVFLRTVEAIGGQVHLVTASAGLSSRTPQPEEPGYGVSGAVDAHWWLDPVSVMTYVNSIRDAFSAADAAGASVYQANASAYVKQLEALDIWIREQVAVIPESRRLLVMNHLSHGYFADRYGFRIVGAVIPSVSTAAAPTPAQMADLISTIRTLKVKAIFVELEENPELAQQIAAEAKIKVVTDLLDHSLTAADGVAPDYLSMMRYDALLIVENLK